MKNQGMLKNQEILALCLSDVKQTLTDLKEPEAALVNIKDLETALPAAKKKLKTQAQLKKLDDHIQVVDH